MAAAAEDVESIDGMVPITMARPRTAASRASKYSKQSEAADSLLSGRPRHGKSEGGRRGRKMKQHRQSRDDWDE